MTEGSLAESKYKQTLVYMPYIHVGCPMMTAFQSYFFRKKKRTGLFGIFCLGIIDFSMLDAVRSEYKKNGIVAMGTGHVSVTAFRLA